MMRFVLAVIFGGLATAASGAADKSPTVVDLLFEKQHIKPLAAGNALNYRFLREVSNTKAANPSFNDDISLELVAENSDKAKLLELKVFTGDRARPVFKSPGMTVNLILTWYLDRCMATFMSVAGGSKNYIKGRFIEAMQKNAKLEKTKVDYEGKQVDGYKITLIPYAKDKSASRMRGYENSTFEFIVSDQVPGHFYQMTSNYFSKGQGTLRIKEQLKFANYGALK